MRGEGGADRDMRDIIFMYDIFGMGYLYELKWNEVDGHAHGMARFMTAASVAKDFLDYLFERLENATPCHA